MHKLFAATALTLVLQLGYTLPAAAQDKPATPQQQRMRDCNKDAEGKKGPERKEFMKSCLSGKQADAKDARSAQQEKMKTCNANAKGMKGAERKAFMSDCLKN